MYKNRRWNNFLGMSVQVFFGLIFAVILPYYLSSLIVVDSMSTLNRYLSLCFSLLAFISSVLFVRQTISYPGDHSSINIIPVSFFAYGLVTIVAVYLGCQISVEYMLLSWFAAALSDYIGFFLDKRYRVTNIASVPFGRIFTGQNLSSNINVHKLEYPILDWAKYDAVVADLSVPMPDAWVRFLTDCALRNVLVLSVQTIHESLTGRSNIERLNENDLGGLLPSPFYSFCKRMLDITLIIIVSPIVLPLMILTALAVIIETRGGALFVQERVGQGGWVFKIYKFRSMVNTSEAHGAQFAEANDTRVTRVGRIIRKCRLDELPQLFNVIKGDMSLIGPRPEQRIFVEIFDLEIPFYNYRHIVKPGITGWAQIMQGYAASTDDTRVKIEFDFYYIKHFSFWLDLLIIFKTLRVILTGFGAR